MHPWDKLIDAVIAAAIFGVFFFALVAWAKRRERLANQRRRP